MVFYRSILCSSEILFKITHASRKLGGEKLSFPNIFFSLFQFYFFRLSSHLLQTVFRTRNRIKCLRVAVGKTRPPETSRVSWGYAKGDRVLWQVTHTTPEPLLSVMPLRSSQSLLREFDYVSTSPSKKFHSQTVLHYYFREKVQRISIFDLNRISNEKKPL